MFVDSHAHLDGEQFSSDRFQVLERASAAGVNRILCIACATPEPESLQRVLELVEESPQLFAALGVHPHDADRATPDLLNRIADLMSHPKVLGWGEIGLDHYYDNAPRDKQLRTFRWQLAAAREAGMPVVIHFRDAAEETCEVLTREQSRGQLRGVMHCFTCGDEVAQTCSDLDFYLGFGGILSFPRSHALRRIAAAISADRYLIETDSPYLAPTPYRGKRNEPSFVVRVAEILADLRQISVSDVGRQSSSNFERLFRPLEVSG